MEWIKCSERMPDVESGYLLTNGTDVWSVYWLLKESNVENKGWNWGCSCCTPMINSNVLTHWMELPPAPK